MIYICKYEVYTRFRNKLKTPEFSRKVFCNIMFVFASLSFLRQLFIYKVWKSTLTTEI